MRQVYGKRTTQQDALTRLCFTTSSSPSKPDCTSACQRTDDDGVSTKTPDSNIVEAKHEDESLLERIASLKLEPSPSSPAQNTRRRTALRERSVNSVPSSPSKNAQPGDTASPELSSRRENKPRSAKSSPSVDLGASQSSYVEPLLSLCNDPTARSSPQPFQEWADKLTEHLKVSKIAEASFGEVYRLSLLHEEHGLEGTAESVLKIIALKPQDPDHAPTGKKWTKSQKERIDAMSNAADVASEVRLLQRMRDVPGFANFRSLLVLQGAMPAPFLHAWRHYNAHVKPSEFPDPGRRGSGYLGAGQLWAVLEMEDAGDDVEDAQIPDVRALWDIFWGVAVALAKGEHWARFEHRDLHLGNVCVRRGPAGLETTLIDYTLSRADLAAADPQGGDPPVAFFDLAADPALFRGDAADDYQYAVYRHMRGAVLARDPTATASPRRRQRRGAAPEPSPWRASTPLTNLVWLHFVLYKLSEQLRAWPSSERRPRRRADADAHAAARACEDRVLQLTEVLELDGLVGGGLESAGGLVGWAVERGWLAERDVLGAEGAEDGLVEMVRGVTLED